MFLVGIDDTDSQSGMCTTYLGALLAERLSSFCHVEKMRLLRLNPNIKWKTRGNASICLWLKTSKPNRVRKVVLDTVEENAVFKDPRTNPGVVFYSGAPPTEFTDFYWRSLREIIEISEAHALAEEHGAEVHGYKNRRGVIGALAAVGSELPDKTYELIAYRVRQNWGKKRRVNRDSVLRMNEYTYPLTFNNVDPASERVLITPSSPCPVLLGIRGENEEVLRRAYNMLVIDEPVMGSVIYETNQGTDAHIRSVKNVDDVSAGSSVALRGVVSAEPRVIKGGHVVFSVSDGTRSIDCAAYEPTRDFRRVVASLMPGDEVVVYGGVRMNTRATINLEKIKILRLREVYEERNPLCGVCGRRMESAGKNQGLRCRRCGTRAEAKERVLRNRAISEKFYQVPPGAMRHLSMPLVRTGFIT
jgi:tRNA(Ile2)-agmatinylcytidine synthase